MNLTRKTFSFAQLILAFFVLTFSAYAAGEVDTSFNPSLILVDYTSLSESIERTSVRRVVVQPDGKFLAAGYFNVVNMSVRDGIARFNADGSLDTTFNPPILTGTGSTPDILIISALALQADGKILIGGNFTTGTGTNMRRGIARLNTDGSLDLSFNINTAEQASGGTIRDIEVSADGKIIIGGDYGAGNRQDVIRVLPDGTVDAAFNAQIPSTPSNSGAYDVAVQPDGKILTSLKYSSGDGIMYRFNADGSIDFSHAVSGVSDIVNRFVLQPDGKILLGGSFEFIDGFTVPEGIMRLNANGTVDTSFNISNSGASSDVTDIELLAGGKILISGSFGSYNGVGRQNIAVLNSDGSLDNSYIYTGRALFPSDLAVQADGKLVVATRADWLDVLYSPLARLNADASVDTSIQPFMGSGGKGYKVLVQPDGKILVGGFFNHIDMTFRRDLVRFDQSGMLDSSFVPLAIASLTGYVSELDLQPDGKILAAGNISNAERRNTDGTFDFTFSNSPNPPSIRYLPDGKYLLVSGEIVRYSQSGFFESQTVRFNFGGVAYKAAIQPDGKIIIVGTFTQINFTTNRGRIARLNSDGTFDAAFEPPGGANGRINDVFLQADGKILIGGQFTSVNGNSNYKYLARLNADGTLDGSFNPILNGEVTCFKMQPNGRILVAGAFSLINGISRKNMARLLHNGTLDNSFNLGSGTDGLIRSIDLQADGKIIIGGDFRRVNGAVRFGVARLLNSATAQQKLFDFDGDGRADLSVFRPSTNRWYEFLSSFNLVAEQTFGINGDLIAPADYDGDGKTDIGIYRASSGDWWYLSSLDGGQKSVHWGQSGDIPRPSDFDGDGKADFIVFRPSNSTWYRFGSTGATSIVVFGLSGDKPVTGDFDGDGKTDVAIFRPSDGNWWWQSSVDNAQRATRWGISTDIPAAADFDGDGKTDFCVYRPDTGTWYIINSTNGSFTILNFGIAEDKPVPADYDGDGQADIAVFRPSTGTWYLMRSTNGFTAQQFGVSSDIPTPNAFVP
jgi:uncharacterized delta-60 repeat protein